MKQQDDEITEQWNKRTMKQKKDETTERWNYRTNFYLKRAFILML